MATPHLRLQAVARRTRYNTQGVPLIVLGAFLFSTAILFTRMAHDLDAPTIAFYRALFAFIFMGSLTVRFRAPLNVRAYRDKVGVLVLLGIAMSLTVSSYTYAIQNTTAANASLLVNSSPLYVAMLAPVLLREAPARTRRVSLLLALVGMVLVANPFQRNAEAGSLTGFAAGAFSGLSYAFVMMLGRSLSGRVDGLTQTMWGIGITALVMLPFALQAPSTIVADNLLVLIPLGIFSLGLAYLCYFIGLQHISSQVVSVVALLEPVSGVLIGLLAFSEIPSPLGAMGGLLILASIYLITR